MLNFREELIKIIEPKKGNPIIKEMAEKVLKDLLVNLKKCDSMKLSESEKITFMCTDNSIIIHVYDGDHGTGAFSTFSSTKNHNKEVFEEIRRKLKYENLVDKDREKENSFSILLP